jgi:hypothetical protein
VLKANNLYPNDPKAIMMLKPQNSEELINSLGLLSSVPKKVTDLASQGDILIHGKGMKRIMIDNYVHIH